MLLKITTTTLHLMQKRGSWPQSHESRRVGPVLHQQQLSGEWTLHLDWVAPIELILVSGLWMSQPQA